MTTTTFLTRNLTYSGTSMTQAKFPFLYQNFKEIYHDNSDFLLTQTTFHFPPEFQLLGFYCILLFSVFQ